eukprot:UN06714
MHSKNVVHFDISLENLLVNDIKIEIVTNMKSKKSKLKFVTNDIQVKLCDFGTDGILFTDLCQYKITSFRYKMKAFLHNTQVWPNCLPTNSV